MTEASTHLDIWDQITRPNPKALKAFQRSGGFKGTAINPMYTLHTVTELFGPCGTGWGMLQPEFRIENNNVYCSIGVWYKLNGTVSAPVWGVGGEALTGRGDDEAFKKAYTDALGNALKHLGANADIYFNLWDGNKYVDEKPQPQPEEIVQRPTESPTVTGTPGASKASFRPAFEKMQQAIYNTSTKRELKALWTDNMADIDEWPPDFVDEIKNIYLAHKADLDKRLAA